MSGVAETVVMRPSWAAYRRFFSSPIQGLGLLGGAVGVGTAGFARSGIGLLMVLGFVLGVAAATVGTIAVYIATSRVVLGPGEVQYRRWLRRSTVRLDHDVVGVLGVIVLSPVGRLSKVLVLRSRSGGPRIQLNGAYWREDDLVRIASAAGVATSADALTTADVDRIAPGTMPWRYLHPKSFGALVSVPVIAAVVVGVIAWFDVRDIPPFDEQPPRAVSGATAKAQDDMVAALQYVVGGRWETPEVSLTTCQDDDDYKGWQRRVDVSLAQAISDEGRDIIVTPVRATERMAEALEAELVRFGHRDPYRSGDLAELSIQTGSFLRTPRAGDVRISFLDSGYVSLDATTECEVPGR
ncbi:hypothetical protein ASD11_08865 [Aeromicrobium sp. Root495]|uniref:hypothetical protein n=1 Tax=Aeromicrobium sp. Root495 TaxID=1736550 RepID=UPI0006F9E747|nr:hypothetical protein [Aeromicrobium sp. Root495]KQY59648.1 hypothetical protein ASD11_08865 [Aeromicrobium sp. Root495]